MKQLSFPSGMLAVNPRPEYARAYHLALADQQGLSVLPARLLSPKYTHNLHTRLNCVIAGTAGQRIGSSATAFSRGAVLSGLYAAQRSDHPVTVRTGYSLAQVVLDREEPGFAGLSKPDLLVIVSSEGLNKVSPYLAELTEEDNLFIDTRLLPVQTRAVVTSLDFKGKGLKRNLSLLALSEVLRQLHFYPMDAYREAVSLDGKYNQNDLQAMDLEVAVTNHSQQ